MISKRNGLSKLERLHSRKQMDAVFASGKSVRQGPLKLVFIEAPFSATNPTAFMFTVSKRQFKRAHDRNYIKRLLREVFRVHKHSLNDYLISQQRGMQGCFLFLGMQMPNYANLEKNILRIFAQLIPPPNEMDQPVN